MNFWDYPVDFGRYHMIVVYPGDCVSDLSLLGKYYMQIIVLLANADYDYSSVFFISLRDFTIADCVTERNSGSKLAMLFIFLACGNGYLDTGEECDDGNTDDYDGVIF